MTCPDCGGPLEDDECVDPTCWTVAWQESMRRHDVEVGDR